MSQGPIAPDFGVCAGPMSSTADDLYPAGTPVYVGSGGSLVPARANASATVDGVVGLLIHPAAASAEAPYRFAGELSLTTDQWDSITGESGGLTPGERYFVSSATAGKITKTAPSSGGTFVFQVGVAESANTMQIQLGGAADLI